MTSDNKKLFSGRTLARSQALQLLFQAESRSTSVSSVLAGTYLISQGPLDPFAERLSLGTDAHRAALDALIIELARNWDITRMLAVDRNLLRLAIYEMCYIDDIDVAVTINESVNLAKAYGTDESSKFVNGILGKVAELIAHHDELLERVGLASSAPSE